MEQSFQNMARQVRCWATITGLLWLGGTTPAAAINVSPSKNQGGSTNAPHQTTGAPSLFSSPFKWIFGSKHSSAMDRINAPPNFKVELRTEPKDFTAATNAVLRAHMEVMNQGKDKYILEFESAQHHDFIIQNREGKEVYRYSSNKIFSQQTSSVVVNQTDKLTYEEELFSASNQVINLPAGEYRLIGKITAKNPISVETSFQVAP